MSLDITHNNLALILKPLQSRSWRLNYIMLYSKVNYPKKSLDGCRFNRSTIVSINARCISAGAQKYLKFNRNKAEVVAKAAQSKVLDFISPYGLILSPNPTFKF